MAYDDELAGMLRDALWRVSERETGVALPV